MKIVNRSIVGIFVGKITVVTVLSILLGAGAASAGKPVKPPADSGRDVIYLAGVICDAPTADANMEDACALWGNTNGGLVEGRGCEPVDPDDGTLNGIEGDAEYIDYSLRNCEKNEAALVRRVSSAVLSIDGLIARDKIQQAISAADYLCAYAEKYALLVGAGKLTVDSLHSMDDPAVDLGADAKDLADHIIGNPDDDDYCY